MKQITNISILLLLVLSSVSYGQVQLGRQVIGTTGGYATGGSISVSSTVGEAVIQTKVSASFILTQGFQQTYKGGDSTVTAKITNETCRGAEDGEIQILNVLGCPRPLGGYQVIVKSVDDSTTVLDQNTLATGEYNVVIIGSNGCAYPIQLYVGVDSDEDCKLKFYSGITPNGDGQNDVWIIDNIELFPENEVAIYNRWGDEVWSSTGYNNDDVAWVGNNNGEQEMADATYFYVAKIGEKIYRGWVELTR